MEFQTTKPTNPTSPDKPKREVVRSFKIPCATQLAPSGVTVNITSMPHRCGDPNLRFYEAWVLHNGATLRSAFCFHVKAARQTVLHYINHVSEVDGAFDEDIGKMFDEYNWQDELK